MPTAHNTRPGQGRRQAHVGLTNSMILAHVQIKCLHSSPVGQHLEVRRRELVLVQEHVVQCRPVSALQARLAGWAYTQ